MHILKKLMPTKNGTIPIMALITIIDEFENVFNITLNPLIVFM